MTLRATFGAVASEGRVAEAANNTLQRGGTAIDACLSAWFAAAGVYPGVLLGPLHLLVSGPGVGAHAYDGSVLQPGKSAPRPRGFRQNDVIPEAALVAVSSSVHAAAAAHAQDGRASLLELASAGAKIAQAEGARERGRLLRRIGEVGPLATREAAFVRPLLDLGGRAQGGNLTTADLESASAVVTRSSATSGLLRLREPLAAEPPVLEPVVACACDAGGVLAVMHCAYDPEGLKIEPLELAAPRLAVPVRRGVPRIAPGDPLRVPAPIAIALESSSPWAAVAVETHCEPHFESLLSDASHGLSLEQSLRAVIDSVSARAAIAMVQSSEAKAAPRAVRVLGSV